MSECVVRMEMPHVCITDNGYYGYCPMDRIWCIQRNAPPDITMREAYEAMTEKIPSWCPILCQLPEGHGRLVDADSFEKDVSDALVYGLKEIPSEEGKQIFHVLMQEVLDNVKKRETIVPAERREKDGR